jgi:hypothetical protein
MHAQPAIGFFFRAALLARADGWLSFADIQDADTYV